MSQRAAVAALVVALLLASVVAASGADPTATPAGLLEGGDPRSDGAGPGLVGSPLLVLGAVVALGLVTAIATASLVKLLERD